MARPKLTNEQRATLLEWLAADYDSALIKQWFGEREWPSLSDALITYYRHSRDGGIARLRQQRRDNALTTGLALKEERIARLAANADALEAIKWEPDKNGRLYNEKAWRECLADIAAEMGDRKTQIELRDWREAAKQAGVNPERVENELERIIASEMGKGTGDSGGDSEGNGANTIAEVDAAPDANTAAG